VPDFKAVQAARMQQTKQMLLDLIAKGDVNSAVRGLLGELEETQSTQDIALAALKILSAPARSDDSQVIPDMRTESAPYRSGPPQRGDRDIRGGTGRQDERKRAGSRPTRAGMVKIYLGIGRDFGVSPGDIVGAIANEVGIPGKDLGAIDITDRFSLIEVPEDVADYVVDTMQNTRIRGRRVMVRHDRPPKS
jgi:ATP-dependent RNA helicase DeaD